jgi:hypothetical protein
MANTFRKGIYPADVHNTEFRLYPVASSSGTAMFVGDVVSAITGGSVAPSAAGDNAIVLGTVCELFDNQTSVPGMNAPVPVGMWASTVTTKYLPASTAGYAVIAIAKPGVKFVAQTNTIMTTAAVNKSTALVAGAGNTTTGQSGHVINGNDLNSGNQFIILSPWSNFAAAAGAQNDITIAGALWLVEFNEGLNFGVGKSTGV